MKKQVIPKTQSREVRKPGRPLIPIDWKKLDQYLQAQCEGASIARIMGVHPETLYDRVVAEFGQKLGISNFSEYRALKRAEGLELIRLKQFDAAMAGDKTMLIWLGKQLLGQKDQVETTLHVPQVNILPVDNEDSITIRESIDLIDESNQNLHQEPESNIEG